MPLVPLFLPGSGKTASSTLSFVDSTGLNPLPPGVIVTLTANAASIATAMLQAGGVMPVLVQNGTYLASFVGTQAPLLSVTFTTTGTGATVVTVPSYISPAHSSPGYALEAAYNLVQYWHDVTINSSWIGS